MESKSEQSYENQQWKIEQKIKPKGIEILLSEKVNEVLAQESNLSEITNYYDAIINHIKHTINLGIEISPESISMIFQELNNFTNKLNTKKLYVSYPKLKLQEFNKLNITDKIKHLLIPKQNNELKQLKGVNGGNCHNWTLLYKEIFDDLNIENKIILFEPRTAHSLLLIEINGEYFIVDTEGYDKFNFQKININQSFPIGNHMNARIKKLKPFLIDIEIQNNTEFYDFKPKVYKNKNEFIQFIDTKDKTYFLAEYRNIETGKINSLFIRKNKGNIIIDIEGIFKKDEHIKLSLRKLPKNKKEKYKSIDYILFLINKTRPSLLKMNNEIEIIKNISNLIPDDFIENLIK